MRCEQADELFNPYLDGELAPSLAGELAAHCLQCPDCRQALALIEVTGHLLVVDDEPVVLDEGFTDRLMACLGQQRPPRIVRLRRYLNIGAPLAAAAVITLALLGVFENKRFVAGEKEFAPSKASSMVEKNPSTEQPNAAAPAGDSESDNAATVPQPLRWESLPRAIERLFAPRDRGDDAVDPSAGAVQGAPSGASSPTSIEDL